MTREQALNSYRQGLSLMKKQLQVAKMRSDLETIRDLEFYIARDELAVSALTSLISCKECKFFERDSIYDMGGIPIIVAHNTCKRWGRMCMTSEGGYCYLAEKKTDETE